MPMIFFNFLKIIFDISTSKRSKTYLILVKKKIQNFWERSRSRVPKHNLRLTGYYMNSNKYLEQVY